MGFQSGLSGLNASAKNLDVIGNNVANSNTVGFKSSRAVFADVFASSLAGAGASNIGIGTKVSSVLQEFTQGNITVTSNPLDLAINGRGFLRLDNNGAVAYSRNGQLHLDEQGYIVNGDNLRLTGYPVDATGNIVASAPMPLQLSTSDIAPHATGGMQATLNLDSRAPVIDRRRHLRLAWQRAHADDVFLENEHHRSMAGPYDRGWRTCHRRRPRRSSRSSCSGRTGNDQLQ
jgi:flagellar hook protein FlgE